MMSSHTKHPSQPQEAEQDRSPSAIRCTDKKDTRLQLPVLEVGPDGSPIRKSRSGKRRAIVLLLVHVLILGHVLHWLWAGTTVTPVEPSEAMETLKYGRINAGFIFFAVALLATLLLGRWVCGWGCHLVAYQDLTLWVLKKLHLRPKPFRSRLLLIIPLIAAIYMFLWPLVYRFLIGIGPPKLSWHLTGAGFWDTFPGYGIALLTVLICGMAIIYFLGPKGFCTYACPYGAFFAPVDKLALGRIRVTDDCRQCGHCTAVCTSNVDVAQEVKLYQMVVDPGCMKCLDCVSVCPNDALYYGFGPPAIGRTPAALPRPTKRDLTTREELLALVVFAVTFISYRGLYGKVPFLMSLGAAAVATYLVLKLLQCLYRPDVLMQKIRLKVNGQLRFAAVPFFTGVALLLAFTLHSGFWRYHDFRARSWSDQLPSETFGWRRDAATLAQTRKRDHTKVDAALTHLQTAQRWGLFTTAEHQSQIAWLELLRGNTAGAIERAREFAQSHADNAEAWVRLANFQAFAAQPEAARQSFQRALTLEESERARRPARQFQLPHETSALVWTEWAMFLGDHGDAPAARQAFEKAVAFDPDSTLAWLAFGSFQISSGEIDAARVSLIDALRLEPANRPAAMLLDQLARREQDFGTAAAQYSEALQSAPSLRVLKNNRAHALARLGRYDESIADFRSILGENPDDHHVRADLGAVLLAKGDVNGAIAEYEALVTQRPNEVELLLKLAFLYEAADRLTDAAARYEQVVRIGDDLQRDQARRALEHLKR